MPEWLGIVCAFAVVVVLVGRMVPLGPAVLAGAGIVGMSLGLGLGGTLRLLGSAMVSPDAVELALLMALITLLNRLLQEFGLLEAMIAALTGLLRSTRLSLVAVPSVIGLLPVPGAAIISAPLVDNLGSGLGLSATSKAAINIVFRHAWFFVFPFMPSLILAARLAGLSVYRLGHSMLPLTLVVLVSGYLTYLHRLTDLPPASAHGGRCELGRTLLVTGSPILLSLGLSLLGGLPLPVSLVFGVGLALYLGRRHPRFSLGLLGRGIDYGMVLAMPAIIAFRTVIAEAEVIGELVRSLVDGGLPLLVLAFLLPAVIGFTSASHTTAIGVTFPLILPLVAARAQPALAVLMFTAGYFTYIISPLHLCQILTMQYFRVKLGPLYREYLVPMGTLLVAVWTLVWLYLR